MGYRARAGQQPVGQADAEDEGGVPPAQSEVNASSRPAILPEDVDEVVEDDGSGTVGGASGASGGGSGMRGHPDAERPRARE